MGARIDKEIQDRTNADNALGTRIDDEEDAREAADTQLQTNITAEETARKAADKTLQDNIDATNAHTINTHRLDSNPVLNGTDIKLDGYSENEGTTVADLAIKATDTTSQAFGKVQKRINVDKSETDTKINKVKTAVGLTDNLGLPGLDDTNYLAGSENLISAVKELDNQIKYSSDDDGAEFARIEAKIDKEVQDRTAADTALKNELNGNINTAKSELQDNIDAEETARIAADEALDTKLTAAINKEVSDRKAADTALKEELTAAINKEVSDRTTADNTLNTKIDKEISDRTAADTAMKTELTEDINDVLAALNAFKATKSQANGLASLDENGKVPANQLPSYVDDVIDVYATYDVSATNEVTNIKLYTDEDHTTAVVGEGGKSYNDITPDHPGYQFRWSGTTWVQIVSGGLIIGEITGTAFDGAKGKALEAVANGLPINSISSLVRFEAKGNNVNLLYDSASKGNGNIYKANPSSSISIPAVTTTKAGVMTAADKVKLDTTLPKQISDEVAARTAADEAIRGELADDIAQEVLDRDAAIKVAKDALQASISKEVTDRTNADATLKTTLEKAIADAKTELETADATLQSNITKEVNDRKGEITRVEKLITDEAATRAQADIDVNEKVDSHIGNKSNPHGVTKAQVGLGNVNNTSDADKPVSTAQATAIADAKAAGTNAQTNLTTHMQNMSNPHGVTRDQLGLGTTAEIIFKKVSAPSGLWKESDERLKTFIKPLEHTLDEICSIPTDSFMIRGNHDIGTIAQTIEKYFPELVSENTVKPETVPNPEAFEKVEKDGETYILVKEVDYSKMSVLAIEGIKLLKAEIDELREKLLFTNLD